MPTREDFLRKITENEDDPVVRLVYADWLQEQGDYDEEERQRKWTAAKQWIVSFCKENNPPLPGEPGYEDWPEGYDQIRIPYEELMTMATKAYEESEEHFAAAAPHMYFGGNQSMCDAMRARGEEFWRNWSIVTGLKIDEQAAREGTYGCGC